MSTISDKPNNSNKRRVVVTGIGALSPLVFAEDAERAAP